MSALTVMTGNLLSFVSESQATPFPRGRKFMELSCNFPSKMTFSNKILTQ